MYAHQVIDDLTKEKKFYKFKEILMDTVLSKIRDSQKFHISDIYEYNRIFPPSKYENSKLFYDYHESLIFPYELCWFDYQVSPYKIGILTKYYHAERKVGLCFFEKYKNDFWVMLPIYEELLIGYTNAEGYNLNYHMLYNDSEEDNYFIDRTEPYLTAVQNTLMLLNCKNIGTVETRPSEKLNKAKIKRGKQPIYTYHTLVLKPIGKKQESIPKHLWNNRIHLCRGHFATYTKEKPLFGKYAGRFWIQAHVKGRNKDGVVMKDYEL